VTDNSATEPPAGPGRRGGRERIGIFGGTFNPVHACHLRVAEACRKALALHSILFVPAGEPPLKRHDLAPARHRLAMVRRAVEGHPHFVVTDLEVERPGPSYTLDTLRDLAKDRPDADFTLILGLDAVLGIGAWHLPDQVLRACPIAVLFRPGARFSQLADLPALAGVDFAPLKDCCGTDPEAPIHLFSADGIRLTLLPIPPCPVSGTRIRAALKAGERAVPGLPESVENYIIQHHLYA
jgi:nicotinate-nucleotide adenylyltransferase